MILMASLNNGELGVEQMVDGFLDALSKNYLHGVRVYREVVMARDSKRELFMAGYISGLLEAKCGAGSPSERENSVSEGFREQLIQILREEVGKLRDY